MTTPENQNSAAFGASEFSALLAENSRLREQVKQLQERRDRVYEDMLYWRGIDPHNGDEPCKACGGSGVRVYGSTSTWRGGIGGQMMTNDICDKCWGSGNAKAPWMNLRTVDR